MRDDKCADTDKNMLDARIIGKVIRKYREEAGKSQEVLSGLANIERTHLSAIENGVRKPTLETFYRIGHALGVGPCVLLDAIEVEMESAEK